MFRLECGGNRKRIQEKPGKKTWEGSNNQEKNRNDIQENPVQADFQHDFTKDMILFGNS